MLEEKPRRRRPRTAPHRAAPANKDRGEHSLTLGGIAYRLRPSHTALAEVEQELGAIYSLWRRANGFDLTYEEIGILLAALIRAGASPDDRLTAHVSASRIAELVFEEGVANVLPFLVLVLADAITGGRTVEGELKAVSV